ncbi:MAG: RNA-binding protein [Oscillospiraceae bacterium]|nr:RNA-binding protein [Oscillospiraceae bacterium]
MISDQKQREADSILLAHVQDMVKRNAFRGFTDFLDMRQYTMVTAQLRTGTYRFFGGYPDAQRGILCIHPEDFPPEEDEFPLVCLTITHRTADALTHRDVLGSIMAQQVQRDTLGDIIITSGKIQCFATPVTAEVCMQMTKIGRVGVKITDDEPFSCEIKQEIREISGTVAAPRLDAVLRTALNTGRGACAEYIRGGLVTLNYRQVQDVSCHVAEGDVFSVRGFGKFRVGEISGPTKKGRLHITIEKFL